MKYIIYHFNNVPLHTEVWTCYNSNCVADLKHVFYVLQSTFYFLSVFSQAQIQGGRTDSMVD
jgi:hypothetical protein